MSRSKASKGKPTIDYNASINESNFGRIYSSMLKSKSYLELSIGAQKMYLVLRAHAQSQDGRRCLYRYSEVQGKNYTSDKYFVFPKSHATQYGYKAPNVTKYIKELEAAGFIKTVENNQHRHNVNVYAFVSAWKENLLLSHR